MKGFIVRHRPSPAMAVALLALAIALGGTSYAAIRLPKNSVGTKQIKADAVTGAKVKDASLFSNDFAPGQVPKGPKGDTGPRGLTGPRGVQGVPGPSSVRYVEKNGQPKAPDEFAPITTLALPAGKWLVTGQVVAVNFDAAFDIFRCRIVVGATAYFGAAAGVSNANLGTPITPTAAATLTNPGVAVLECRVDGAPTANKWFESVRMYAINTGDLQTTVAP